MHVSDESKTFYLTTTAAAEKLGVSPRTVQKWAEEGVLETWKTSGGHRRVSARSVELMLAQRRSIEEQGLVISGGLATFELPVLSVVIADDDEFFLEAYREDVAEWAIPNNVFYASNGLEAMLRFGQGLDLAIFDLNMPGLDGFGLIKAMAGHPALEHTVVAVVSALSDEEIAERGGIGTAIRIQKPVDFRFIERLATRVYLDLIRRSVTRSA